MNHLIRARVLYGLTLAAAPRLLLRAVAVRDPAPCAVDVVRVLGLRDVSQALACAPRPTGPVMLLGVETDALHAGSMIALAALSPRWRHAAVVSGAVAAAFAVVGGHQARGLARDTDPRHSDATRLDRLVQLRDRVAAGLAPYAMPKPVRTWTGAGGAR